jgi:hypothetical protein
LYSLKYAAGRSLALSANNFTVILIILWLFYIALV